MRGLVALLLLGACASTPTPTDLPAGASWVAIGQEPGWRVDVRAGDRIEIVADYGERRGVVPYVRPSARPGTLSFRAVTEATDMELAIRYAPCTDGMSGRPYPASATLTFNGRRYEGCAEPVSGR